MFVWLIVLLTFEFEFGLFDNLVTFAIVAKFCMFAKLLILDELLLLQMGSSKLFKLLIFELEEVEDS